MIDTYTFLSHIRKVLVSYTYRITPFREILFHVGIKDDAMSFTVFKIQNYSLYRGCTCTKLWEALSCCTTRRYEAGLLDLLSDLS